MCLIHSNRGTPRLRPQAVQLNYFAHLWSLRCCRAPRLPSPGQHRPRSTSHHRDQSLHPPLQPYRCRTVHVCNPLYFPFGAAKIFSLVFFVFCFFFICFGATLYFILLTCIFSGNLTSDCTSGPIDDF